MHIQDTVVRLIHEAFNLLPETVVLISSQASQKRLLTKKISTFEKKN